MPETSTSADTDLVNRISDNLAAFISLTAAIHEADWNYAGPEWRYERAAKTEQQRSQEQAFDVLKAVEESTGTEDQQALIEQVIARSLPAKFNPRRITAKAQKAVHWFSVNPIAFDLDRPVGEPVRSVNDYAPVR